MASNSIASFLYYCVFSLILELYYPGRRPYGHRVLFRVNLGVHCLLSLGTSHPFEDEITRKLRFTGAGILAMVPPLAEVKV